MAGYKGSPGSCDGVALTEALLESTFSVAAAGVPSSPVLSSNGPLCVRVFAENGAGLTTQFVDGPSVLVFTAPAFEAIAAPVVTCDTCLQQVRASEPASPKHPFPRG